MTERTTPMTEKEQIRALTKEVESLKRTNMKEMEITNKMFRLVLLKATQGTYLKTVLNNPLKEISLLSVADQYLEGK